MSTEQPTLHPLPASRPAARSDHGAAGTAVAGGGFAWAVLAAVGIVGFVALTIFMASVVASHATIPFDQAGLDFAHGLGVPAVVWSALSESANIPLIVIGFGIVAWLLFTHRRREALLVFLMLAAITAGSEGVKQLVARPRPSGTDPNIPGVVYSYPSGHVLEAMTILGIIVIRLWRTRRPLALRVLFAVAVVVWVALVGLARVGLAAHYPSDVLGGVLASAAALGIYGWFTRSRHTAAGEPPTPANRPYHPTEARA